MKQITRCVIIHNREHYLVMVEESDFKVINDTTKWLVGRYGTIPYEWVDNSGRLVKQISVNDVLPQRTIQDAIESRKLAIETESMDIDDAIRYMVNYHKSKLQQIQK